MKTIETNQMIKIEGGNCFAAGLAAPFAIVLSGFIPTDTLDEYWGYVVNDCF